MAKTSRRVVVLETDYDDIENVSPSTQNTNDTNTVTNLDNKNLNEENQVIGPEPIIQTPVKSVTKEPLKGSATDNEIKRGLDANSTIDKDISIRQLQNMLPLIDPKDCNARTIRIPNEAVDNFHKIKSVMGKDFSIDGMISVTLLFGSTKLFEDMKKTDKFKEYMLSLK